MSHIARRPPKIAISENLSTRVFQREWQIYRKMVDNNYLFHREAYDRLHQILIDEVPRPFSFLAIAM